MKKKNRKHVGRKPVILIAIVLFEAYNEDGIFMYFFPSSFLRYKQMAHDLLSLTKHCPFNSRHEVCLLYVYIYVQYVYFHLFFKLITFL